MSRDGSVTLGWGGDIRHFRYAWGEIISLQEARDTGPYVVLDRLLSGRWFVEDIADTIKFGLIGGGMSPIEAVKLVEREVMGNPPLKNLVIAQKVLGAGLIGSSEEDVGKKQVGANPRKRKSRSPTAKSDLPPSTETAS